MSIATSTALIIGGVVAGGLGVAGSALSSSTQANAANNATETQAQEAQNALNFQEQQYNTEQQQQAPFLQAGQNAVTTLSGLVPQLNEAGANYPQFQAPTASQAAQTPGYQFALQQGENAVQNSAAARGGLLSGNTLNAEQQYGQGLADTNYQQVYNNALGQYQQSYNQFQNQQSNTFNRYASLAGIGQTSAGQQAQAGQQAASNVANINLTTGQQQGQSIQNAGAATASGYAGATNAVTGAIGNVSQNYLLSQLLNQGGGYGTSTTGQPNVPAVGEGL